MTMNTYEIVHSPGFSPRRLPEPEQTTSTLLDKAMLALSSNLEVLPIDDGGKWAIADTLPFALLARYRWKKRKHAQEAALQRKDDPHFVAEGNLARQISRTA